MYPPGAHGVSGWAWKTRVSGTGDPDTNLTLMRAGSALGCAAAKLEHWPCSGSDARLPVSLHSEA
jgi:hypothetical protein